MYSPSDRDPTSSDPSPEINSPSPSSSPNAPANEDQREDGKNKEKENLQDAPNGSGHNPSFTTQTTSHTNTVMFECNICLETASEPVITLCGHLFCWPCIYQWIHHHIERECPVCKSMISKEKLIPLYGRGRENIDPRKKQPTIPDRPAGQRSQPTFQRRGFQNAAFAYGDPYQFDNPSFRIGFGVFPSLFSPFFGIHTSFATNGSGAMHPGVATDDGTPQEELADSALSRMFLAMGIFCIFVLMYL